MPTLERTPSGLTGSEALSLGISLTVGGHLLHKKFHGAELIPILLIRTLPLSLDEEVNQVAQKILGLSLGALRSQVDDLLAQVFGRFRHRGVGVIEEGIEGFLGECDLGIRQVDRS